MAQQGVRHVKIRKGDQVVVIEVDLPRRWLRRSARNGLWYTYRDMPPGRIRRVLTFGEWAGLTTDE